jgi:hypothetical protein
MSRDYQKHPSLHPYCIYLRMKYRWQRLMRKWHLHYVPTLGGMIWRVYTIDEDDKPMYYNIFRQTRLEAIASILIYIWGGSESLINL